VVAVDAELLITAEWAIHAGENDYTTDTPADHWPPVTSSL
jgi:hypothetical protein